MPGPVNRRASLPGASELFRPTREPVQVEPEPPADPVAPSAETTAPATGRVRHSQKITVYFSDEELIALEDANLELRRAHGIRVDRGRIVRLAVSRAVADLTANGAESFLVSELTQQ
ncbi:hypothetical protein [Tessaracoccus sp. G1721]